MVHQKVWFGLIKRTHVKDMSPVYSTQTEKSLKKLFLRFQQQGVRQAAAIGRRPLLPPLLLLLLLRADRWRAGVGSPASLEERPSMPGKDTVEGPQAEGRKGGQDGSGRIQVSLRTHQVSILIPARAKNNHRDGQLSKTTAIKKLLGKDWQVQAN